MLNNFVRSSMYLYNKFSLSFSGPFRRIRTNIVPHPHIFSSSHRFLRTLSKSKPERFKKVVPRCSNGSVGHSTAECLPSVKVKHNLNVKLASKQLTSVSCSYTIVPFRSWGNYRPLRNPLPYQTACSDAWNIDDNKQGVSVLHWVNSSCAPFKCPNTLTHAVNSLPFPKSFCLSPYENPLVLGECTLPQKFRTHPPCFNHDTASVCNSHRPNVSDRSCAWRREGERAISGNINGRQSIDQSSFLCCDDKLALKIHHKCCESLKANQIDTRSHICAEKLLSKSSTVNYDEEDHLLRKTTSLYKKLSTGSKETTTAVSSRIDLNANSVSSEEVTDISEFLWALDRSTITGDKLKSNCAANHLIQILNKQFDISHHQLDQQQSLTKSSCFDYWNLLNKEGEKDSSLYNNKRKNQAQNKPAELFQKTSPLLFGLSASVSSVERSDDEQEFICHNYLIPKTNHYYPNNLFSSNYLGLRAGPPCVFLKDSEALLPSGSYPITRIKNSDCEQIFPQFATEELQSQKTQNSKAIASKLSSTPEARRPAKVVLSSHKGNFASLSFIGRAIQRRTMATNCANDDVALFNPKRVLVLTKFSRLEFEKRRHKDLSEVDLMKNNSVGVCEDNEMLLRQLESRGSDYQSLLHHHKIHTKNRDLVVDTLRKHGLETRLVDRFDYTDANVEWADVIFTTGGDGTFLMAASKVKSRDKPVIGVNSDPSRSIGYLCLPGKYTEEFPKALQKLLKGEFRWLWRQRIRASVQGEHAYDPPIELHNQQLQYPEYRFIDCINEEHKPSTPNDLHENCHSTPPAPYRILPIKSLNEVFVGESLSSRVSYYEISIDGSPRVKVKSSGVTICSGTGSTSWSFNINKVTPQCVQRLLEIVKSETGSDVGVNDKQLIANITKNFNDSLIFDPSQARMAYTIRDPVFFVSGRRLDEGQPDLATLAAASSGTILSSGFCKNSQSPKSISDASSRSTSSYDEGDKKDFSSSSTSSKISTDSHISGSQSLSGDMETDQVKSKDLNGTDLNNFSTGTHFSSKPRGFAKRIEIRSRMFDACLVIDGSLSFVFNDGATAVLEILEQDALKTVTIDE